MGMTKITFDYDDSDNTKITRLISQYNEDKKLYGAVALDKASVMRFVLDGLSLEKFTIQELLNWLEKKVSNLEEQKKKKINPLSASCKICGKSTSVRNPAFRKFYVCPEDRKRWNPIPTDDVLMSMKMALIAFDLNHGATFRSIKEELDCGGDTITKVKDAMKKTQKKVEEQIDKIEKKSKKKKGLLARIFDL